jgi:hypothetical protein
MESRLTWRDANRSTKRRTHAVHAAHLENARGTLDIIPTPDLAPTETSEAWWQEILARPHGRRREDRGFVSKYGTYTGPAFYTLADVRTDEIEIACAWCPRRLTLRTADVVALHGRAYALPSLLTLVEQRCEKSGKQWGGCSGYFVGLPVPGAT